MGIVPNTGLYGQEVSRVTGSPPAHDSLKCEVCMRRMAILLCKQDNGIKRVKNS